MNDTVITMKKKIFDRIKHIFPEVQRSEKKEPFNPDDEWINKAIIIHIKDSTP